MSEELLLSVEGGVAVLTLNRPERLNALTRGLLSGLRTHLAALAEDPEIGCVVLTGAGRAFCSGGDVRASPRSSTTPRRRARKDISRSRVK